MTWQLSLIHIYLGVRFCSLVNSGSSANLVAFMTLTSPLLGERRVKRGDEIITVACGFPTTVAPAIQFGAVPVFVDVTIPQYNIDAEKLEEALSEKTKAVMIAPVSYTHLDVYKRQIWLCFLCFFWSCCLRGAGSCGNGEPVCYPSFWSKSFAPLP